MSISEILSSGNIPTYVSVMLKGFGAAVLSHICATVCRDCGKPSIADLVETAGKLEIFILCLPLISDIMRTAAALLEM